MIYVGIDDTDTLDSPGTNKLARGLATELAEDYRCPVILRHQLLRDPRVPFTSKNSAASLLLEPNKDTDIANLYAAIETFLNDRFVAGSDPGVCIAQEVPPQVTAFGQLCQSEVVTQQTARRLAGLHGLLLHGLGGTEDGVIGALAAVGLAASGNDGRVVHIDSVPAELTGLQDVDALWSHGVEVVSHQTGEAVTNGTVDIGKHLRPSYRRYRIVQFVVKNHRCPASSSPASTTRSSAGPEELEAVPNSIGEPWGESVEPDCWLAVRLA